MELKKIGGFESTVTTPTGRGNSPADVGGPSFRDTFDKLKNQTGLPPAAAKGLVSPAAMPKTEALKFSNHAVERMQTRGIKFTPEDMQRLNDAVSRAAAKGSKDSLILMNDSALIVSVKNNTVVTVMDKTALKENVFTNIDSTIVM